MQEGEVRSKILEYIAYLASSARNSIEEPHIYGSFRLIDAISRLIDLINYIPSIKEDQFLKELKEYIDTKKYVMMFNTQEYLAFLDEVVLRVVRELKKQTLED